MPIERIRNNGTVYRKKLNAIRPAAGSAAPVDPDFASVLILAHFDGVPGSNTFIDSSSYARGITAGGVSLPEISASNALFDQSGAWTGGPLTQSYTLSTDVLDLNIGGSDFTIEGAAFFNAAPSDGQFLFAMVQAPSEALLWVVCTDPGPTLSCFIEDAITPAAFNFGTTAFPIGSLFRYAFVRHTNAGITSHYVYINGIRVSSDSPSTLVNVNQPDNWKFGTDFTGAAHDFFDGYMDEFRFTAVARYTGPSYTLDTAEFPDQ